MHLHQPAKPAILETTRDARSGDVRWPDYAGIKVAGMRRKMTDVSISAQNIANTGEMRGTTLALSARDDLRNIGGALAATGDMSLTAGRDIVMETTTASGGMKVGNVTTKATVLDQVASLSAGGVMVMQAGRDVTLEAVKIDSKGEE